MLEPGIEPGTSWLVVRSSDHQSTRLVYPVNVCICVLAYKCLCMRYADPNLISLTQVIQILLLQRWLTNSPGTTLNTRRNTRGEMANIYTSLHTLRGRGRHDCISEAMTKTCKQRKVARSTTRHDDKAGILGHKSHKGRKRITEEIINLVQSVRNMARRCNVQSYRRTPSSSI